MRRAPGGAAVAYFGMAVLLVMAVVWLAGGNARAGGIMVVLAALLYVVASFLRRGE